MSYWTTEAAVKVGTTTAGLSENGAKLCENSNDKYSKVLQTSPKPE